MSKIKATVKNYDTLEEAILDASGPDTPAWQGERSSRSSGDSAWKGGKSFDETVRLAREGWPEGLKHIVKGVQALAASPSLARGPSFTLDTGGAYPIAALAAANDPACMVSFAPVSERVRPIIRLGINVTASAMYQPEAFLNYGAGIVGLIDALESADYRVELTVIIAAEYGKETALFTVKVKEAQDHIDLSRLAFVLSHVGFFRRIGFGLMERNLEKSVWGATYGRPRNATPAELPDMILLSGLQQFQCGGPELKSPAACFEAMLPVISQQLADKFADMPPLQFKRAA